MRLNSVAGVIDRRILVNYRVHPDVLARRLPPPFRPHLVAGYGVAGVCLIRLKQVRPVGVPPWLGVASENAAHRVAVEWDEGGTTRRGVYIPRRDTNLRVNVWLGGRLFPGVHHAAAFDVHETAQRYALRVKSDDGRMRLDVQVSQADALPAESVFTSLDEAAAFFLGGSHGYSPGANASRYDAVALDCEPCTMQPLAIERIESSYFDDRRLFPDGTIAPDCALLMQDVGHAWSRLPELCCPAERVPALETAQW
jgi:hypothetical protein